jgi:hypothetical protein
MGEILQLNPHVNMTVDECLQYAARNSEEYQDVIVIGYDLDGQVMIRSSHMTRAEAAFLLMKALDHAKGIE